MLKTLVKNETAVISTKFPESMVGAPTWRLLTWNDDELLTGTASLNGSGLWSASITVPKALVIPNGEAELTIEFIGVGVSSKTHVRSKTVSVVDAVDDWQNVGLLYNTGGTILETYAFYDVEPVSITATLREGYGATPINVASSLVTLAPGAYSVLTSKGYGYKVSLPMTPGRVTDQSGGIYPYQFVIEAAFNSNLGRTADMVILPVQVVTPQIIYYVNSAMRLLDKARLDEIDPSLQWHDEEMVHFVLEAVNYLNGLGAESYWTAAAYPPTLLNHLSTATAMLAIQSRLLAEGLTSFEFQGSNTQLSFNRQPALQNAMDTLNARLEQHWPTAKSAALRAFGKGNPPPGMSTAPGMNLGWNGFALGPTTNRTYYANGYRPGAFWRY